MENPDLYRDIYSGEYVCSSIFRLLLKLDFAEVCQVTFLSAFGPYNCNEQPIETPRAYEHYQVREAAFQLVILLLSFAHFLKNFWQAYGQQAADCVRRDLD